MLLQQYVVNKTEVSLRVVDIISGGIVRVSIYLSIFAYMFKYLYL